MASLISYLQIVQKAPQMSIHSLTWKLCRGLFNRHHALRAESCRKLSYLTYSPFPRKHKL